MAVKGPFQPKAFYDSTTVVYLSFCRNRKTSQIYIKQSPSQCLKHKLSVKDLVKFH